MVIAQGEIWWADLPVPVGSGPGFRRPILIIQGNLLNQSRINTTIGVPLSSNLKWADAPGNVRLASAITGLPRDSVANVSQMVAIDKELLIERVGKIPSRQMELVFVGVGIVFGR